MSQHHMSSMFYDVPPTPDGATVVKTGYLLKSPPYSRLKKEHLWKRRFFVLNKSNKQQDYQLKYFISDNPKDRALGEIDLRDVRAMLVSPDGHPGWSWVQKNVKCSPSCVLYINTSAREYFLVGDNSLDVSDWLFALSNPGLAEENLCGVVDFNPQILKERSMTEPAPFKDASEKGHLLRPSSESIYDYPIVYRDKQPESSRKLGSMTEPSACKDASEMVEEPLYVVMDKVVGDAGCHSDDRLTESVLQALDKLGTLKHSFLEASAMEAPDNSIFNPDQRDIEVQQADLTEHLSLSEVDGRLSVLGWTGQPLGLFHKGDQFLALNDLLTCSMAEFQVYLSRTLKKQVKVTILRHLKGAGHRPHNKGSLPVKDHSSPPSLAMPPLQATTPSRITSCTNTGVEHG